MTRKSILIVEDSPIIAERLENMLRGSPKTGMIRFAGDYAGALRSLSESVDDIVLLDINLPGKSGISLLKYIKKTYPSMVVIMTTNQSNDFYRRACRNLGADYFLDKSKEFENLPAIIASLP